MQCENVLAIYYLNSHIFRDWAKYCSQKKVQPLLQSSNNYFTKFPLGLQQVELP